MARKVTKPTAARTPAVVESDRSYVLLRSGWRRIPAALHLALRRRLAGDRSPNLFDYHELGRLPLVASTGGVPASSGVTDWTHTYAWGNNPVRAALKGRRCRVLASGSRMTVLLEVEAHGQVLTSRRALRRIRWQPVGDPHVR